MLKTLCGLAGSVLAGLLINGVAKAGLIINGNFEQPYTSSTQTVSAPDTIPGWAVTAGAVEIVNTSVWQAYASTQSLGLVGNQTSSAIGQSFATTAGTTYTLTFAYANNPIESPSALATADVIVRGTGNLLLMESISHSSSTSPTDMNWTIFSAKFTADSTLTDLTFSSPALGSSNGWIVLDHVNVTPEPASITLFSAIGASLLCFGRLRKKASREIPQAGTDHTDSG